jgi:hypothetical protein
MIGVNTFAAVVLQTVLTLVVVDERVALALDIRTQVRTRTHHSHTS